MKRLSLLLLLFTLPACAATYTASSPSWTDVSNALVLCATQGDTLQIPAGAASWTNTLQINKGVQVLGAGTNSTFITNRIWPAIAPFNSGTHRPALFHVLLTNDYLVRFSGITAELCRDLSNTNSGAYTNSGSFVLLDPANRNTNAVLTKFILDHCYIKNAYSRTIYTDGDVYGVIASNLFENCFLIFEPTARHDVGWFRPWNTEPLLALGTTNVLVCEDNVVLYNQLTESWNSGPNITASGQGGSYVYRFNILTNSANARHFGHDFHGNNYPYSCTGWRGTRLVEIYGNTYYSPTNGRGGQVIDGARGGTAMLYSNNIVWNKYTNNVMNEISLWEEETYRAFTYELAPSFWLRQSLAWVDLVEEWEQTLLSMVC